MSPLRAAVLLVLAATLVAGCLPEQGLDTEALEQELTTRVSMEDDSKSLEADCDGGLEAEDGARTATSPPTTRSSASGSRPPTRGRWTSTWSRSSTPTRWPGR
jgi:hypothetical protein